MDYLKLAFEILHLLSIAGSLTTIYILTWRPASTASKQEHQTRSSASHRLLRIGCINAALMSFMILLPGLSYGFDMSLAPSMICWFQGLMLQYLFLAQHMIMFIIATHNWLLLVRWKLDAEQMYRRWYWFVMFGIPSLVVLASCSVVFAMSKGTMQMPGMVGFAIGPRPGYCFWDKPVWIRLMAYSGVYVVAALPGTVLSTWVAVYLFRTRHSQKQAFSATATPESGSRTTQYRKLYQTISRSILYRTAFFAMAYMVVATMSYLPTLVQHIGALMGNSTYTAQLEDDTSPARSKLGLVEFSTSLAGICIFLVFGTGAQAMTVWRSNYQSIRGLRKAPSTV